MKLRLPDGQIENALAVLQAGGYTVTRNGVGVLVDVLPSEKAAPIHALHAANIEVTDFEVQ